MTTDSQAFKWSGINNLGKRESGTIDASDLREAQTELKKMGIEVITLQATHKMRLSLPGMKKKIKPKDILFFTRYLSTMLAAGLPIIQSLDIIAHDQENSSMQAMVLAIKSNIAEGKTLAEAFGQYPQYFSELYCNLIKAGEKSGTLEKILTRLANYLERTEMLKRKIRKAMIYPIAIMSVAGLVGFVLLIFVVPQFEKMFASFGADLPFFTRIIVNLSKFVTTYWWLILLAIGGAIWGFRYAMRTSEKLNLWLDKLELHLYIIGTVVKKGTIARYARTLATTLEAGMPIVESMNSMSQIISNRIYRDAMVKICEEVVSGHQLSTSMSDSGLFPNLAVQMVAVGEASGKLSDMLNKVADYYEDDVNTIVDNLSSLLEPVIMLVLGVVVGSFVIAMYLPIFRMGSLF